MQIVFDVSIRLFLNQSEFTLIGKALSGRLKPKELEEARELNQRLLEARLEEHRTHIGLVERALQSVVN